MKICITILLLIIPFVSFGQGVKTKHVIIVTLDGYRWQELYSGADKKILFNDKYVADTLAQRFWDESATIRREKLTPFLWQVVGEQGQLYGNRKFKNKMRLSNATLISYPGYSEMLVGFADKCVRSNKHINNPNYTVLEYINDQPAFNNSVAAFSTWEAFEFILRKEKSGLHINTGADKAEGDNLTRHEHILNRIIDDYPNPHSKRFDNFTFQYAFEYLKRSRPKVLFIGFDETDAHAHGGRYDQYLYAAHRADSMINHLWKWIQADEQYKDQTTLIVATDHGRGKTPKGWRGHGIEYRGSSHVWMAVIGPDTPAKGEMKNKVNLRQHQIAKTIASFLDLPYQNVAPVGETITSAFHQQENTVSNRSDLGR